MEPGLIEVWALRVSGTMATDARLAEILSREERVRMERFRQEMDRARYAAAHAGLRVLLSQRLQMEPAAIRFERGAYGKPQLATEYGGTAWRFNLSHSGELALIALSRAEVGVDVEAVNPAVGLDVAETFCSADEMRQLEAMREENRTAALHRIWTAKEAVGKASGAGIASWMREIAVELKDAGEIAARRLQFPAEPWFVRELEVPAGYVGAVAAPGGPWTVRPYEWSEAF